MQPQRFRIAARAVTLVESLVAIGTILVLAGLLSPAIARARERARETRCQAQLASHGGVLAAFAAEHRDRWPNAFESERSSRLPPLHAVPLEQYGQAAGLWHLPVLEAYGEQAFHASLICPSDRVLPATIAAVADRHGVPRTEVAGTLRYSLSMSLLYAPRVLMSPRVALERRHLRTQTHADVQFPSNKCAVFDLPLHDRRMRDQLLLPSPRRVNALAGDASVRAVDTSQVAAGIVLSPTGSAAIDAALADAVRLSHTPDGVRGRDW